MLPYRCAVEDTGGNTIVMGGGMSAFSWGAFLSQPLQALLLVIIAILLVFVVADWIESRGG